MKPFIKWAGGKRKFAEQISSCIGEIQGNYYEPFIGSGAILLYLCPRHAVCADINTELINLYNVVKKEPNALINELEHNFVPNHNSEFYYYVRAWDRNPTEYAKLSSVVRAARSLYLNKTCYNGIWRVNGKGEFNVPIGKYVRPSILVPEEILSASKYFQEQNITFKISDFRDAVHGAKKNDFVYFDPPYDVDEGQNSFLSYTKSLFNRESQKELKKLTDQLIAKGVRVGISNSNTTFIRDLYLNDDKYKLAFEFSVNRTIGATNSARRAFSELFIISRL